MDQGRVRGLGPAGADDLDHHRPAAAGFPLPPLSAVIATDWRRDLCLITAGLGLEGGGRALLGRLLASAGARWARERSVRFDVLALADGNPLGPGVPCRSFGGARTALAAAILQRQLGPARPAFVYDLLGLARAQALLPRRATAPTAIFLLGIEVWRPLPALARRALAAASHPVAISAHTAARAQPFLPPGMTAPEVIPLALEERPADGEPDADLLARLAPGFLLTVGRMSASERYKGHDEFLEALPLLLAVQPEARLVVAGGGDDRARLEEKARRLGVSRAVTFTGFVREATLEELYRRAAAFVLVSRGEGFGLVYLEAMRAGVPSVAARGSAAEEILTHDEHGLLVAPDDREELAAALGRLLGDPTLAQRLGHAGHQRWQNEFRREHLEARLFELFDRLTGR